MIKVDNSYMFRKILLGLLPAAVFWYNYSLMTTGQYSGLAFMILWGLCIWNVIDSKDSNFIMERHFRLTEVAFFLLPLSSLIFTFVIGAQAVGMTGDEFEQAGAAIGTAIGGTFVIFFNLLIGGVLGLVMHIIAGKYDKKTKEETSSPGGKHGILITTAILYLLAIILGTTAAGNTVIEQEQQLEEIKQELQTPGQETSEGQIMEKKEVDISIEDKTFIEADIYSNRFSDEIGLDLQFTNNTDKEIVGVKGVLTIYNIFDEEVKAISVGYDDGLLPNESKIWESVLEYNQFIDEDVALRNLDVENMKYTWSVDKVIYKNGS